MRMALLCALVCGCGHEPPPLDEVLAGGSARAGKVTKQSELIGGPVAYGRVGDVWKLYNSKVRFLIQDVGTSVGLSLYGGNLIDADLVRPGDDGQNGNDLFRESFPIVGLHVQDARQIEVISDGLGGGPAHLRVRGGDAPSDIIPQLDTLAQDLGGEIITDYILEPDAMYLTMATTYKTRPGQSLSTLLLGDFLSFGASLALFYPESGFSGNEITVSFIASAGDKTSYGYVYEDGSLQLPVVDASGTATLLTSPEVPQDGSVTVKRHFVVGDGSVSSLMGTLWKLRRVQTARVSGTVRDAAGQPVPGARVTLFRVPFGPASQAVDQAIADASGKWFVDAPPGSYVAIAGGIGRLHGKEAAVALGEAGATLDVEVGTKGQATFQLDGPAKLSFKGLGVEPADSRFGPDPTEDERYGLSAVGYSATGSGSVDLKPGEYQVTLSRGVEYEVITKTVTVPANGSVPIAEQLMRVVDTTGWLSGDYHQHTQGSIDSPVPVKSRLIENLAEGIEFPAATDHDNITDYRPHIAELGAQQWVNAVPGDEISVNGVGHFNAYPLSVDAANPYAKIGVKLWARKTVDGFVSSLRSLEPQPIVVHVSHPRTASLSGYFNAVKFDPTTGLSNAPLDPFDAIEVNGDLGQPSDFLPANDAKIHANAIAGKPSGITLRDWFALLNQGKTPCALGNSDTHARNGGTGYPRNFVRLGTDDPRAVDGAKLVAAIKAQQVVVSNGPFVTVNIDGKGELGKSAAVSLAGAPSAQLRIKVQAPAWVPVSTLEVYANGRPLTLTRTGPGAFEESTGGMLQVPLDATDASGPVVRLDGAVKISPLKDSWYVVVVRASGSLSPVGDGSPYGYTNPIYVDTAGDGWTAPGL
jgi:hypothetical protein